MHRWLSIVVVAGLSVSPIRAEPIINGSFEQGLDGWEVSIDTYMNGFYGELSAGTVTLRDSFKWNTLIPANMPTDGSLMAFVGSQSHGHGGADAPWDVTLSQTLTIDAGTLLSGHVFLYNGDYIAQEQVWVHILDAAGAIVATPWAETSGSLSNGGTTTIQYTHASPWTQWTWQPLVSGSYTLVLGVTTKGDNQFETAAGHDSIRVTEPSTLWLVGLGLAAIGGRRRSKP